MMSLKALIPSLILFSFAPMFFILWFPLRLTCRFFCASLFWFLDEKFYSVYQRCVLFFYEHYSGSKIVLYGDVEYLHKGKENVLYMSNHQSAVDWVITDMLAARQGGIGRIRYILKEELKYIPFYGFYFNEHGCIFVNRKQFQLHKTIEQLTSIKRNSNKCWMVIFPEGTRTSSKKRSQMENSQEFARKQGLTPLNYHLTPRVRGSELTVQYLGDYLDAVYDATILYSHCKDAQGTKRDAPQLFSFFNQRNVLHIHLRRISMREVPFEGGEEFRQWLHQRFVEKDKMLEMALQEDLVKSTSVFGKGAVSTLSIWETVPSLMLFMALNVCVLSSPFGLAVYVGLIFLVGLCTVVYSHFCI